MVFRASKARGERLMKQKLNSSVALLIAVLAVLVVSAPAQNRKATSKGGAQKATPAYSPRIVGRSDSFIIEGAVVAIKSGAVTIKTARGARLSFVIDEETTLIESNDEVSIATMADISFSSAHLRASDCVEIVAERAEGMPVARIITRIRASRDQVARR